MRALVFVLVLVGLVTTACDNSGSTDTTSPTSTVPTTSETFSDTVGVQGQSIKPFTVSQVGPVSATLTAVGPPATVFVGLGVGTFSAGTCALAATINTQASTIAQISGTATLTGQYCVEVYDIGNLTAPVTYSVTVTHP
jgi:hypothetical protein